MAAPSVPVAAAASAADEVSSDGARPPTVASSFADALPDQRAELAATHAEVARARQAADAAEARNAELTAQLAAAAEAVDAANAATNASEARNAELAAKLAATAEGRRRRRNGLLWRQTRRPRRTLET